MEKYAKKYSKSFSKDFSPWKTEFDAMAEKTMLRRLLSKYGQMTIEMAEGIATEQEPDFEAEYKENANSQVIDIDSQEINTETGEITEPPTHQEASEEPPTPEDEPGF
jgi:recombination protein RecT